MIAALCLVIFVPMLIEARRAARNEADQRARGGIEPPGDVYKMMRVAYPAAFLAMLAEGAWRGFPDLPQVAAGATLFVLAKALKWWAILTLGPFWTFRVIVRPGVPLVTNGPYRWLRHPNYVGVAGEFAAVALMTGAILTSVLTLLTWAWLLLKRISIEASALGERLN